MESTRCTLEVLKFLDAFSLLKHACLVDRRYRDLTEKDELWYTLLGSESDGDGTPKQQYKLLHLLSVPVLRPRKLLLFRIATKNWTHVYISESLEVDRFYSIVELEDKTLFVTGSQQVRSNTFTVHPTKGTVTFLPSLKTPRNSMGVIYFEGQVFAFAGNSKSGYMREAEVFRRGNWVRLPHTLCGRCAFNPCARSRDIYLVGGCGAVQAEKYSVDSNRFDWLDFETPGEYCTVASMYEGQLVALQEMRYFSFHLDTGATHTDNFSFDLNMAFWSNAPVIQRNGVFYVHQENEKRIVALNLQMLSFETFDIPE